MMVRACLLVALFTPGIAGLALAQSSKALQPYLGLYQGNFESALTADPFDDLNFNPCTPDSGDCSVHTAPHIGILLALSMDEANRLRLVFYRSETELQSGQSLDLLGRSCGTRVGALSSLERGKDDALWIARFELTVENGACRGKLRPTSSHSLVVRGMVGVEGDAARVEVAIDRRVASNNYLYVKEDGVQRRVRLDLDNTQGSGRRARYRVCIEDQLGDFGRCVVTDKELKQIGFPLPVPGGVAVSYTWWYDLAPNLKRTRDLYEVEQYVARFEQVQQ